MTDSSYDVIYDLQAALLTMKTPFSDYIMATLDTNSDFEK